MQHEIDAFITYLHNVKKKSLNTELSYKRDLSKMVDYFAGIDIIKYKKRGQTLLFILKNKRIVHIIYKLFKMGAIVFP